ncbi:phage portal protein [Bifidobacterium longum subsp. longum]|uniref:phage portal protein n=1 Tax=Bifidobacterium longum TaxID=216816 RepID=UPI0018A5BD02|nr:phage portal protein [Bifidobacterium longum]QOL59165.1 phage portal protein [Bifidobacterium longum subsp. longum]
MLRDRLQTYDKGLYLEFDRDAQLRGDPEAQYKALVTATGRPIFTTNEARELLNNENSRRHGLVTPLNVLIGGQTSPNDGKPKAEATPNCPITQRKVTAHDSCGSRPARIGKSTYVDEHAPKTR